MAHVIDTLLAENSAQVAGIEVALRVQNIVYVKKNPGPGEYLTVEAGLTAAAALTPSSTNPVLILVGPGVYSENPLTMISHVYVAGAGNLITRITAANASAHLITAKENSAILNCLLTGVTGSGFAAVFMSSSTAADTKPFICDNVKFGNNDNLAIVSAVNNNNLLVCTNCIIGGEFQFNKGFKSTTTGSGIGRILLKGCTTNTMTATLPDYVGYASGAGCQIIVNACQFNTGGTSPGSCMQVDNGASLRITALNARGYAKALWAINSGTGPTLFADACTLENNTQDIQIDHPSAVGNVLGIANLAKITNSAVTLGMAIVDMATGFTSVRGFRTKLDSTATSASTLTLVGGSGMVQVFTGSTAGQILKAPDATTLQTGHRFEIWNISTVSVAIQDNSGGVIITLNPGESVRIVCDNNASAAGHWLVETAVSSNTTFSSAQQAFEDFMFDAYEGAGSNDNQYAMTAVANSGASDVDGAITAVGNDYEGIHMLDTLTSASSRPLVSSFDNVNRIKLGAQQEIYEGRVRVQALSDASQTFSVRFGLMDGNAIGAPVNGVSWLYTHSTNSGKWQAITTSASSSTLVNSNVTVNANQWYKLKAVVNMTGTQVDFYIDDVLIGSSTTNIPTAAMRFIFKMEKTVGTTSRKSDIDYIAWRRVR